LGSCTRIGSGLTGGSHGSGGGLSGGSRLRDGSGGGLDRGIVSRDGSGGGQDGGSRGERRADDGGREPGISQSHARAAA
jgi:hypothetical protein